MYNNSVSIVGAGSDVFAAIAAPTRREILRRLAAAEMPVTELAGCFDMTMSAVSQHLGVLREAGLVNMRKEGKQRFYRLNADPLRDVSEWLSFYEPFWIDRLERLGDYLEKNS
jgi:DNA-binding transcriptional ArsR family regulator